MTSPDPQTRRAFLRGAATTTAALTVAGPAWARRAPRRAARRTVAIFGGGIAGLTAAHELAERGFDVSVYERRAFGGKARSTQVAGTGVGGRAPLPGEHGYRIFFGFYQNLPDTMRRIPSGTNARGVLDNLVAGPQISFSRAGKRDLVLPIGAADPRPYTVAEIADLVTGLLLQTDLPPQAVARFALRMVVFLSSCDARRVGQWENTTWADFIAANQYTDDYYKLLAVPFTQLVQASKADRTSAEFSGHLLELMIYNQLGLGATGPMDRSLNAPTNEAFIDPWISLLQRLGVHLRDKHELTGFDVANGRISGALVRTRRGCLRVEADWYICALPVERARRLWSKAILAADPGLARTLYLNTAWMNGVQFYLLENRPIVKGHVGYVDSPWALSSVNQAQFWARDFAKTYGDGRARDCLSVDIANWTSPGILLGKPAQSCTPDEIAREVWEQVKRSVNEPGETKLTDDLLLSWSLDPGLVRRNGRLDSEDPLVLPTVGTQTYRPESVTRIPNLLLTGDYLNGDWELANMEAANYNARRAVNALLATSGVNASLCDVIDTYRPPEWEPLKQIDADRYNRGQANLFDQPLGALLPDDDVKLVQSLGLGGLLALDG